MLFLSLSLAFLSLSLSYRLCIKDELLQRDSVPSASILVFGKVVLRNKGTRAAFVDGLGFLDVIPSVTRHPPRKEFFDIHWSIFIFKQFTRDSSSASYSSCIQMASWRGRLAGSPGLPHPHGLPGMSSAASAPIWSPDPVFIPQSHQIVRVCCRYQNVAMRTTFCPAFLLSDRPELAMAGWMTVAPNVQYSKMIGKMRQQGHLWFLHSPLGRLHYPTVSVCILQSIYSACHPKHCQTRLVSPNPFFLTSSCCKSCRTTQVLSELAPHKLLSCLRCWNTLTKEVSKELGRFDT